MTKWRMRRPSSPTAKSQSAICTPTEPSTEPERWDQDTDDVDLFVEGSSSARSSSVPRVAIPPLDLSPAVARRAAKQAKRRSPRQDERRQAECLKEASAQLESEGYFQQASADVTTHGGEIVWPFWFSWLCAPQCADSCGQACEIEHVPHYERAHKIMAGLSEHEERPPEEELSYSHAGTSSKAMAGGPLDYGSASEPEQPPSPTEIEFDSLELEVCLQVAVNEAQQLPPEDQAATPWEHQTPMTPPPECTPEPLGRADAAPASQQTHQ